MNEPKNVVGMTKEEIKINLSEINKVLMTDINEYERPNMRRNNLADLYVRKGNALSAMQPLSAKVYANAKALFSESVKSHLLSLRDMLEEKKITVNGIYTGRQIGPFEIKYVLHGGNFGLPKTHCIFNW